MTMLVGKLQPSFKLACLSVSWHLLPAAVRRSMNVSCFASSSQHRLNSIKAVHCVKPFGKCIFDGPGNVVVAPLSPQWYPSMDQCIISHDGDTTKWNITVQDELCSITSPYKQSSDSWTIQLPIKYDMDLRTAGTAAISDMECSRVTVQAQDGVTLTALKAGHVAAQTNATVHVKKFLLGNISLDAEEVDSPGARLQGQTVSVSTRRRCYLSDIYADRVLVTADSADLRLGTVHGSATVTADGKGQVVIGGVDGSIHLSAPLADVRCHIHQLRADSQLSCGGALHLSLAPTAGCHLELHGPRPDLDPQLRPAAGGPASRGMHAVTVAGGGPRLVLRSPQPVRVRLQSWAAAVAGWAAGHTGN